MKIARLKIENFRGLTIDLDSLEDVVAIIGRNDTGKTNVCHAIRKILDPIYRKTVFSLNDSTNCNGEIINIKMWLESKTMNDVSISNLSSHVDIDENGVYKLTLWYVGTYNSELGIYDDAFFINEDEETEISSRIRSFLDKAIQLLYINPVYDLQRTKALFFNLERKKSLEEKKPLDLNIRNRIDELNDSISKNDSISSIDDTISHTADDEFFDNIRFKVTSNFDISNIYKSLDVVPLLNNGGEFRIAVGDGKSKALDLLLQELSLSNDSEKIIIVEEPENHLYPLLQKYYPSLIKNVENSQVIYTTHSPYIVDLSKFNQIIKLCDVLDEAGRREHTAIKINKDIYKNFGYLLSNEIAEMFFYDSVLLVEGFSEKYFYNLLYILDKSFKEYITKNKMGVFCVGSIDFKPARSLLNELGIKVYIKTDNDIYFTKDKTSKQYAGYIRVLNYLSEGVKKKIAEQLGIEELNKDFFVFESDKQTKEIIENNIDFINKELLSDGIIMSNHHEGFEKDLVDFLDVDNKEDDIYYLKESKLKNLHEYLSSQIDNFKINEKNKENPLVKLFVKNEN